MKISFDTFSLLSFEAYKQNCKNSKFKNNIYSYSTAVVTTLILSSSKYLKINNNN